MQSLGKESVLTYIFAHYIIIIIIITTMTLRHMSWLLSPLFSSSNNSYFRITKLEDQDCLSVFRLYSLNTI